MEQMEAYFLARTRERRRTSIRKGEEPMLQNVNCKRGKTAKADGESENERAKGKRQGDSIQPAGALTQ